MEGTDGMNLYPAHARGAYVVLKYDGAEVPFSKRIESLSYTDNASDNLDDISIVLDIHDGINWVPERGKDLDVTIIMENWYINKKDEKYHCGNFCVDDITLSGGPERMTIKAISQPADSGFKETKKSKTWKKVTLRQIMTEFMGTYGMSNLFFNVTDVYIESIEQSDETDCAFLKKLCEKYGYSLKVYKTGFVVFDIDQYESRQPSNYFGKYPKDAPYGTNAGFEDGPVHEIQPGWRWNTTLSGTYTGATLKYTNGKKGNTVSVTVGTEGRMLYLNEKVDSQAEAQKVAQSRLDAANRKATTMSFSPAVFHPTLYASHTISIVNMGKCDGKYYVDKVKVSLSGSGLTESVTLHKCLR
jgi:phage protein D